MPVRYGHKQRTIRIVCIVRDMQAQYPAWVELTSGAVWPAAKTMAEHTHGQCTNQLGGQLQSLWSRSFASISSCKHAVLQPVPTPGCCEESSDTNFVQHVLLDTALQAIVHR
jgi:hypothetical protein